MVLTITLTGANIISSTGNNLLRYNFPTTAQFDNHEICLTNVTIYYSWYNIDKSLYNNNLFYYFWLSTVGNTYNLTAANPYITITDPTSGNKTTYYYDAVADLTYIRYPVNLPDGIYELQGIVDYMQYVMIQNNTYAFDTTTNKNCYYVNMLVNPTQYCFDVTTYQVDMSGNLPSNITAYYPPPPQAFTPLIQFPTNFNALVGFTSFTTSPSPSVTDKSFVLYQSNIAPQLQPNPTLVLGCDKVINPYANPTSSVYSLASTGTIGSQIQILVPQFIWIPLAKGSYPSMTFSLTSANGSQVNIRDPNMCLVFSIRNCDTDVINM